MKILLYDWSFCSHLSINVSICVYITLKTTKSLTAVAFQRHLSPSISGKHDAHHWFSFAFVEPHCIDEQAEQIETLLHLPVCTIVCWPGPGLPLCNSMFLRACCCRITLFDSEYFLNDRWLANRCCSAGHIGSYFWAHPFGAVPHGSKTTHPQLSGCFFLSVSHQWELWS